MPLNASPRVFKREPLHVGISPSYLVMIETGERLPDLAIRRSLAWEMGVPGWRETS